MAPASATVSSATSGLPRETDAKNTASSAKMAAPAAAPSMPSSRLNALVMPTIHRMVNSRPAVYPRFTMPKGSHTVAACTPATT